MSLRLPTYYKLCISGDTSDRSCSKSLAENSLRTCLSSIVGNRIVPDKGIPDEPNLIGFAGTLKKTPETPIRYILIT